MNRYDDCLPWLNRFDKDRSEDYSKLEVKKEKTMITAKEAHAKFEANVEAFHEGIMIAIENQIKQTIENSNCYLKFYYPKANEQNLEPVLMELRENGYEVSNGGISGDFIILDISF
jgi:hypothetical protein